MTNSSITTTDLAFTCQPVSGHGADASPAPSISTVNIVSSTHSELPWGQPSLAQAQYWS
jgi:hypothetical protein